MKSRKPIRVATDCSGIETPLMALEAMGVKYEHLFSSDIDKNSKRFINNNFNNEDMIFYDDLKSRDNRQWAKSNIDLYVAGFPCQTFSTLGNNKGFDDETKGNIFFYVHDFIKTALPKVFILENVKNLKTHDKGNTYKTIITMLNSIGKYNIRDEILSTEDYDIPQSRKRIYIVGIRKDIQKRPFHFPRAIPIESTIMDYIDSSVSQTEYMLSGREPRNLDDAVEKYNLDLSEDWILNLDFSRIDWFSIGRKGVCPCLVTKCGFYVTFLDRKLTPYEALSFQGIDYSKYNWDGFSDNAIYKFAGNCMSVNVLCHLLHEIFSSI